MREFVGVDKPERIAELDSGKMRTVSWAEARRTLPTERMPGQGCSAAEAAERLASFGKRHRLSLRGLKIKE